MSKVNRHFQRRQETVAAIDLRNVEAMKAQQRIHTINRMYEMGANLFLNLCLEELKHNKDAMGLVNSAKALNDDKRKEIATIAAKAVVDYNDSFTVVMKEYNEHLKNQDSSGDKNESKIIEG